MHRGQSFGHEHTLSPPKRRQPHLTKHLSPAFSLLVIGNSQGQSRSNRYRDRNSSDTLRDTVGCPWGGLLCQQTKHARSMPRHDAVVSDCESLHGRDEASRRADHSSSEPRVSIPYPGTGSVGRIGVAVHMETSAHLLISKWGHGMNGGALFFINPTDIHGCHCTPFSGRFQAHRVVPNAVHIVSTQYHRPAIRRWHMGTLSLGTVTGGSCPQTQPSCSVRTQKLTRP